jgi:hypothetical protein
MPELSDTPDLVTERIRAAAGALRPVLDEAQAVWDARAAGSGGTLRPGWRDFEDAFPTFYQFTNRPR